MQPDTQAKALADIRQALYNLGLTRNEMEYGALRSLVTKNMNLISREVDKLASLVPAQAEPAPDREQIIFALQRQIVALKAQADKLFRQCDYSAEFPAEDADRLGEAVALLSQQAQEAPATHPLGATLPPIERDESMKRDYIPLPGGWELQTKGSGSTLRLCDTKTGERHPLAEPDFIVAFIERMAREVHDAARGIEARPEQRQEAPTAAVQPAQDPEPVAWLVTGGRAYVDRAFISKQQAEKSASERNDGAHVMPLYAAPPAPQPAAEQRWIPVSERLPEDETPVLVLRSGVEDIGELCWDRSWREDTFKSFRYWAHPAEYWADEGMGRITAWMPLPPAPTTGDPK